MFEVPTAVTLTVTDFWVVTTFILLYTARTKFEGNSFVLLQRALKIRIQPSVLLTSPYAFKGLHSITLQKTVTLNLMFHKDSNFCNFDHRPFYVLHRQP
jgi:hypothetical protein